MDTQGLQSRVGQVWLAPLVMLLLAALVVVQVVDAQTGYTYTYSRGQSVSPAYDGWWPNEDGSFTLFFGYMNTNWREEFDVPIGPDNHIEPGGPDQGQPTHFYPRRNPFLFTIRVPKDFGAKELIWTLTTNGKTERVFGSLKSDYQVDKQTIHLELNGDNGNTSDVFRRNVPPALKVDGPLQRQVRVGEPLTLPAFLNDPDNMPPRREAAMLAKYSPSFCRRCQLPGLRLSWIVYRGPAAAVTFSPEQMKTWMDSRVYANSPWSPGAVLPEPPPDGRWVVQATFKAAGTYVLRAVASDGSLFTYENVTVNVTR